jgi:putative NADH-flavin reductase
MSKLCGKFFVNCHLWSTRQKKYSNMKIAVFGSTGGTGKFLVPYALEKGYTLVVLVRDPSKLSLNEDDKTKVTIIKGDVTNAIDVSNTIKDTDIVINLLGHAPNSPKDIMMLSTTLILQSMKEHGVKKLIIMTTAGVKSPMDHFSIGQSLMNFYLTNFESAQMIDHQNMVNYICNLKNDDIQWVIIRAARLTTSKKTEKYHVGSMDKFTVNAHISRADVAHFIIKIISDENFMGFKNQMPFINY